MKIIIKIMIKFYRSWQGQYYTVTKICFYFFSVFVFCCFLFVCLFVCFFF